MIPLSVPALGGNEWKYVKECLDTGWVSSAGSYVDRFEKELAEFTGAAHVIACVNGTAALQIALELVGVSEDDEVLIPTVTFIAPVNAIKYNRARPVFMDCTDFYTLDVIKTARFIREETTFLDGFSYNRSTNRRVSAIVPVHVFGNAVDFSTLLDLCEERNIAVVEDAAESLGTRYSEGRFAGSHTGTLGKAGCVSFNGNKIITTGGGGVIITDDSVLAEKAKYLTQQAKDDVVYFVHDSIGYNYRLTNIQAAMGVAQLELMDNYLLRKQNTFETYRRLLADVPGLRIADVPDFATCNHWMIPLVVDAEIYGKDRDCIIRELAENEIQTRPVWHLNHLQKPYLDCQSFEIETAHSVLANTINLPSSVSISDEEIEKVVDRLRNG